MSTGISVASAKSPRRRSKSQQKKTGPTVSDLMMSAMSASKERTGVSLAALKKTLQAVGYDVVNNKARILNAVRRLVANNSLVQIKGTGASGSFKLNRKPPTPRKKKVVNKKSPKAKKVSAKKAAGDVAPAAIKSPEKKRKAKSPRKAKRPIAAKKSKSPRKAERPAAAKKPKSPRKAEGSGAIATRTRAADRK